MHMTNSSGEYIQSSVMLRPKTDIPEFGLTFSGAEFAATALILVHGFGVGRDSRGLFTEIAEASKDWALTVRGDFSDVEGDSYVAVPFTEQAARLSEIRAFCRSELGTVREVFVGHSQGWLPVELSKPTDEEIFALAPPLGNAFEEFIQTSGWKKRDSVLNLEGESRLVRSDGTQILVPREFWNDFRALGNVTSLLEDVDYNNRLKIYFAGEDNVLGTQVAPASVSSVTIPEANHDFAGASRKIVIGKLLDAVRQNYK